MLYTDVNICEVRKLFFSHSRYNLNTQNPSARARFARHYINITLYVAEHKSLDARNSAFAKDFRLLYVSESYLCKSHGTTLNCLARRAALNYDDPRETYGARAHRNNIYMFGFTGWTYMEEQRMWCTYVMWLKPFVLFKKNYYY